jgi:CxxC motif-containing protein
MVKNLTCVECPLGCPIEVELLNGEVVSVKGNTCPRGEAYARSEVVCPMRVLTTTVKLSDGRMLAVKTSKPIKRADMMSAMKIISGITVNPPISMGEVVLKNIYDGIDLIACNQVL